MFTPQWKNFASKYHLILLAPTFTTSPEELKNRKGYYYPDQWSGDATEEALAELGRQENVSTDKILIFGFSAGAHFAHRFALWKPDQVKGFVAYSAGWWDDPTEKLAHVPALIMCGEADPRYDATWQFMFQGQLLNLPWVWRSYQGTGHEMTPAVQKMAESFLRHYASNEPDLPYYGDAQTYHYVTSDKMETIPPQERIRLPSKAIAEQWIKEN
jgi:dienelactone hydrolase